MSYCQSCADLLKERDSLRARLAAEKKAFSLLGDLNEELESSNRRLREALDLYGEHMPQCPAVSHLIGISDSCTCGYSKALKGDPYHVGRLNPATFFKPHDGFIASCTCGWVGQPRLSDEDSEADIRGHIAKAHDAWLKEK